MFRPWLRPPKGGSARYPAEGRSRARRCRSRSVARGAGLFPYFDGHRRHLAIDDVRAAAFGNRELGVDLIEVFFDHEVDADGSSALLARFGQKDQVTIERHL